MVQFIITRQVLTLVTGTTRLWTGKRGEEKYLGTEQLEDADVRLVSKILCELG